MYEQHKVTYTAPQGLCSYLPLFNRNAPSLVTIIMRIQISITIFNSSISAEYVPFRFRRITLLKPRITINSFGHVCVPVVRLSWEALTTLLKKGESTILVSVSYTGVGFPFPQHPLMRVFLFLLRNHLLRSHNPHLLFRSPQFAP